MKALVQRFPVFSFYVLAYTLTWSLAVPLMWSKRGWVEWHMPHGLESIAAFGPAVAALIALALTQGRAGLQRLGESLQRWRVPAFWWFVSVVSPFVVLLIALAIRGQTSGLVSPEFAAAIGGGALLELIIVGGLAQGFGEEPGWRGFALPQLRGRYGPLLATVALWPIWLCWHLPMFLSRPEFSVAAFFGFAAGIFSAAVWLTAIYDATRSVLMAALWHALINIARGMALMVSTAAFLAFGQVVLLAAVLVVIYWLVRRPPPYSETA